uniref:neoverrucotoxin subunit beta-like n=1 Tax=Pristiophorus japonicus TaxID=55135 RepID=UPI00398F8A51
MYFFRQQHGLNYDTQLLFVSSGGARTAVQELPVFYNELTRVCNKVSTKRSSPRAGVAARESDSFRMTKSFRQQKKANTVLADSRKDSQLCSRNTSTEDGNTPATMVEGGNYTFQMPTLGRPARLGMLYDGRRDNFFPGVTLWDLDALQKNVDIRSKPNTDFSIICSDSIEDKMSILDVVASLKASFLRGLVEVSGSAKYLNDTKTSKQQARVTLNYRATTRFEQLTMNQLGPNNISYPSVFDQGTTTHVVMAVLYGAQAFFVFDRQYSSSDNKHDIEGNLQVMVKKIPSFSIEGKGSVKLSDTEKQIVDKFSCTFHRDFLLDKNPVSYQDALQVYSTLPKLLADNGEKAVPLRVWLYPLSLLDSKAAQIVREISNGLVNRCQLVLDQFRDLKMSCNDLINHPAARQFHELKAKVQTFKEMCLEYQMVFQKDLAKILPSIRGTGQEESGLVDILERKERSPFRNSSLTSWV